MVKKKQWKKNKKGWRYDKILIHLKKIGPKFPSQVYVIKIFNLSTNYSHQVLKVSPKVPNTHLYTKQKETK